MSETIRWTPDDPEHEPVATLGISEGVEIEATRRNTVLVRHLGHLAMYDFIVYDDAPDNPEAPAMMIFSPTGGFDELEDYMLAHDYPDHNNTTVVHKSVVEAFERYIGDNQEARARAVARIAISKIEDFIPEGWV